MSGPRARRRGSAAPVALDHEAATSRADQVFVTAHPAEPTTSVLLRAGEAALTSYVDDVLGADRPALAVVESPARGVAGTADPDGTVAVDPLRRLFSRHVRERSADDAAGELYAAVVAAATVAALDVAVSRWLAAGARRDGVPAARACFQAVAGLLPPEP